MSSVPVSEYPIASPLAERQRTIRLSDTLKDYVSVLHALVLHDIKSRFFGTGLGQILMIVWPFVHILVLLAIYTLTGRQVPYGPSLVLYSCTGVLPFIIFSYMSRWIVFSALTNRSFLQYPIIKPLDLLIARGILELVSSLIVTILLIAFIVALGVDPWPADSVQAAYALGAAVLFSFAMGVFNGAITLAVPLWSTVYILFIILAYVSSGILFVTSNLPESIRVPLSYNPLLQCVEWMRMAYYSDYPTTALDRAYVLQFSLITLALGLILERAIRRFIH